MWGIGFMRGTNQPNWMTYVEQKKCNERFVAFFKELLSFILESINAADFRPIGGR